MRKGSVIAGCLTMMIFMGIFFFMLIPACCSAVYDVCNRQTHRTVTMTVVNGVTNIIEKTDIIIK